MVRSDDELTSQKVLSKILREVDNCKQFFACDAVVDLVLVQCSSGVGDDSFFAVLKLTQYAANAELAGVTVKDDRVDVVG